MTTGDLEMDRFFAPRRLAIAGASNSKRKLGYRVMRQLLEGGVGEVIPIHPRESTVLGLPARADLASVSEPVDLLVALVPGDRLLPLVESAREGQVGYLLAISSGFAEASAEGRRLQLDVARAAAERGIRVVGPNSMGMLNAASRLNASLVPEAPPGGAGLSCVTQSGGFGIAVSMYALDHQLPVAKICDLGNTADVRVAEVLEYLAGDPDTSVVGLYLEAPGDTDELSDAISTLSSSKPVILTALGRSEAGRRASRAHLGLEGQADRRAVGSIDAVIHAQTGRELLDVAKALSWQPPPRGARAAILTATGGIGAEITDLCIDAGIEVPALSASVKDRLAALLPPFAALGNPVDVTPIYWRFAEVYPALMQVLLAAEEVDLLIVAITDVATDIEPLARAIADEQRTMVRSGKPCYVFWGARDESLANRRVLEHARLPCYRSTSETVRAAAAHVRHRAVGPATGRSV